MEGLRRRSEGDEGEAVARVGGMKRVVGQDFWGGGR